MDERPPLPKMRDRFRLAGVLAIDGHMRAAAKALFGVTFLHGNLPIDLAFAHGGVAPSVTGLYAKHAPLALAISRISEDAASVGWEVVGANGKPIPKHPLLDVFARGGVCAGKKLSGLELGIATNLHYKLFGEAFWYFPDLRMADRAARPSSGAATETLGEVELIHPRLVVTEKRDGRVVWGARRDGSKTETLDETRLTHFRRFDPENPGSVRGLSEMDALTEEIVSDIAARAWNARFFGEQNGIPTIVLKPPADTESVETQREEFMKRWNAALAGKRGVGLLPPGWDLDKAGVDPKNMDFRDLREYAREQVFGLEGLPPFEGGVMEKADYANSKRQKEVYWEGTIARFLAIFTATLNADFLPKIGVTDVTVRPAWDKVKALLEDIQEKTTIAKDWFAMGLSKQVINERLEMRWDPKQIEDYEVGYLPVGMIPVSMAGMSLLPETEETEPEETPPGEEPEEEEERSFPLPHTLAKTHRLVRRRSGVYVVRRADGEKEAFRLALWRGLIARRRDLEIRFEQIVRRHMHALQVEVDNNIRSIKGWSASRKMREAIARETPPPLFAELRIKAEGDLVFDRYLADKGIRLATRETFKQALRRGGESLAAELGPSFTFDMLRPEVMSRLSTLTLKIAGINETLERALRASLAEGLAAGEGVDSLAQRAQNVFAVGKTRARAIARTETGGAFTAGREAAMKENGIKNHEWLSSRDDKVRQTHKDEDGSVVAIGTPFPHTKLKHPHDPAGPAEEVINCRCDVLPVVA